MKKLFIFLVSLFVSLVVYADTAIYCPHCKKHLYNYQGEITAKNVLNLSAEDFVPVAEGVTQPDDDDPMVCPFDSAPLNGWEYWAWELKRTNKLNYPALSLLTKDGDGEWLWIPFDIDMAEVDELLKMPR